MSDSRIDLDQIEMDRALYMNERDITPSSNFANFKQVLTEILADLAAIGRSEGALAAE